MLRKILYGLLGLLAILVVAVLLLVYWPAGAPPPDRAPAYATLDRAQAEMRAAEQVAQMSTEEKVAQLHGNLTGGLAIVRWGLRALLRPGRDVVSSGYNERLHIPPLTFTDGPRGIAFHPGATAFPVSIARAASFDPEVERAVGSAMGVEARRTGFNYVASPCVNLLRHPGWGRAQESYGEDPLMAARFGVAHVDGMQRHGVMACPKHYALNSVEDSRNTIDVTVDERALHEVYLPQFRALVDSGAASIMSSYNRARGTYVSQNRELLETILREEWGFRGFVTSDWFLGLYDAAGGVQAGMDVEMPWDRQYQRIPDLIEAGEISVARIDTLVRRVVATKLYWASRPGVRGVDYATAPPSTADHKALARTAAELGVVLLKNEGKVLPLSVGGGGTVARVLLVGPLAEAGNLGDHASSMVEPEAFVGIRQGLRRVLGGDVALDYLADPAEGDLREAAAAADAVVVVAGYAPEDEGENIQFLSERDPEAPTWGTGGDRADLRLKREDVARLRALANVNPNTVAVLIGGSAITVDEWIDGIPAVLMAWYPGERGGEAVARVLTGLAAPGGRLPVTVPREGQRLVNFDPFADTVCYGYLRGYTWHHATAQAPRFPFGFGLGYTTHAVDTVFVEEGSVRDGDTLHVVVRVRNTGRRSGWAVPQAYVAWPAAAGRPDGVLAAFAKASTTPGNVTEFRLPIATASLRNYAGAGEWRATPGAYRVYVGFDAEDARGRALDFELTVGADD